MVNIGRPSTGCEVCRKRRIKCDQSRPGCQRCARYGVTCPGFGQPSRKFTATSRSYVWHSASSVLSSSLSSSTPSPPPPVLTSPAIASLIELAAGEKALLPRGVLLTRGVSSQSSKSNFDSVDIDPEERSAQEFSAEDRHHLSDTSSGAVLHWEEVGIESSQGKLQSDFQSLIFRRQYPRGPRITPRAALPPSPLLDISICYFFGAGMLPIFQSIGPDVRSDWLIQNLYASTQSSCLRQAVKAAALVNYANRFRPEKCESLVFTEYGKAIKSLKIALEDPVESCKDESLLAALMVALYEFYVSINPSWTIKNWTHHGEGVRALLKVRGEEMISTSSGRWLFMLVQLGSNWVSLLSGRQPADEVLYSIEDRICQDKTYASNPTHSVVRMFFNGVTKLQTSVNIFLKTKPLSIDDLPTIKAYFRQIEGLEMSIKGWSEITDGWRPMSVTERLHEYPFQSVLATYCYTSLDVFLHYLVVWIARIKLCECALKLSQADQQLGAMILSGVVVEDTSGAAISRHIAIIRQNVSDFLGSIAYGLGDIDERGRLCVKSKLPPSLDRTPSGDCKVSKLRSMEIFVPLSALQASKHLDLRQKAASEIVLRRIQDDFRTR